MENPLEGIPREGTGEDSIIVNSVTTGTNPAGTGEGSEEKIVSLGMQPNNKRLRSEDKIREQLLPRLPNQITLSRIVPKISWREVYVLASVSRAWRKAIQHHHIYDARIHSCSTDTLLVHTHIYDKENYDIASHIYGDEYHDIVTSIHINPEKSDEENYGVASIYAHIALYSIKDKLCYNLPPIPGHKRGVPMSCACVSLDGKIYVLGGAVELCPPKSKLRNRRCNSDSSSKVYVLNLAGASHWKECASMKRGRQKFGCAAFDGKIYVFGGKNNDGPVREAEVYDPKENTWSAIMPMGCLRFDHKVFVLAEKLVVLGGEYYDRSYTCWKANPGRFKVDAASSAFVHKAEFVEVYDPVKDEWSRDFSSWRITRSLSDIEAIFEAEGKFHGMDFQGIYVKTDENKTLEYMKFNSFSPYPVELEPVAAILLNGELVAGLKCYDEFEQSAIIQSKGFGTETTKKIDWKWVSRCPGAFDFMYCIQL